MNRVPRLFPNSTIVCIGSGPSLTVEDVNACRGAAPVIAINDVVRYAPWADCLYACDRKWWQEHPETAAFGGMKYGLQAVRGRPDVLSLDNTGDLGVEVDPTGLRTGKNSGYQAINLAVHFGATRIVLLGYDMQRGASGALHFFGNHHWRRETPPFATFLRYFDTLVEPLRALGIEVVNASRRSALTAFPKQSLETALREVAA